jgi:hypothetical protein
LPAISPLSKRGQSESSSRRRRHNCRAVRAQLGFTLARPIEW